MNSPTPMRVVRRRWRSIVVMAMVGLLGGLAYVLAAPVTHRATASAFFSLTAGNSAADLVQGSTYTQNQVDSFALLATTPAVLQPVIDDLDLRTTPRALARQVEATVPVGTVIVEVAASDASPQRSARLADAVLASLSRVVEDIAPQDADGRPTVVATTVAPAQVPTAAASPDVPLSFAVALLAGLATGAGLAWGREALDTRVRDADVLGEVTDRPLIGTVGAWTANGGGRVVVAAAPHSPPAEAFRKLRTNLQFLQVADASPAGGPPRASVLAVTSSLPAEGKSTVSGNLAVALAETGARVLLVDADLRRPAVADLLGVEGGVGLTTVLAGAARVEEVVQDWGSKQLQVLASGPVPPNPAELLGSPAMRGLLEDLRGRYDHVVIDTAPLLPVADAAVLSRLVDGTVLVAQAGRVRRAELARALGNLDQVSARVLGVVLNRVRREESSYSYGRIAHEDVPQAPAAGDHAPPTLVGR
jgi:polysaccharide biosynthesis transport protein